MKANFKLIQCFIFPGILSVLVASSKCWGGEEGGEKEDERKE